MTFSLINNIIILHWNGKGICRSFLKIQGIWSMWLFRELVSYQTDIALGREPGNSV